MKSDLININVMIAERFYPLSIEAKEEERIRQAARVINEKIRSYQQVYAAKDKQDFLAMIALNLAVDNTKKDSEFISTPIQGSPLIDSDSDLLHKMLDDALQMH